MALADKIKQQEEAARKEGISGGKDGWVKIQEGDNRFRVLSEPEMLFEDFNHGICYTDCGYEGSAKFLMYVLDRKDNKIKLWKAPYTVGTSIAGYETDEEYRFDSYPMPYDVKLNAKNAGTKEVKYTLVPGRATTPVGQEVMDELGKKKGIADIISGMKEKNKQEHIATGFYDEQQAKRQKMIDDIETFKAQDQRAPSEEVSEEDIPF